MPTLFLEVQNKCLTTKQILLIVYANVAELFHHISQFFNFFPPSNLFIVLGVFEPFWWVLLLLQGISSYTVANRNSIKGRIKTTGSNKWDRFFFFAVEQTKNNQWTLVIHSTQTAYIVCVLCNSITIIKSITIKNQKKKEQRAQGFWKSNLHSERESCRIGHFQWFPVVFILVIQSGQWR